MGQAAMKARSENYDSTDVGPPSGSPSLSEDNMRKMPRAPECNAICDGQIRVCCLTDLARRSVDPPIPMVSDIVACCFQVAVLHTVVPIPICNLWWVVPVFVVADPRAGYE